MKPERITVEVQTDASGMARILDKARAQKATFEPVGPSGSLRCDGVVGGLSAEALAERFHEAYERLAPKYNYTTRKASAVAWADVPANNKALMVAVCAEILTPNNHDEPRA